MGEVPSLQTDLEEEDNLITILLVVYTAYGTSSKGPPSLKLEHLQKTKVELTLLLYSRFVSHKESCIPDTKPKFCIAQCFIITNGYIQFVSLCGVYIFHM